jgi:hypothetical protein
MSYSPAMTTLDDSSLFEGLAKLKAGWPGGGWSWDGRMCCVTSSFPATAQEQARAATLAALPTEYTKANVGSAPAPFVELVECAGGLRPGQSLFVGEAPGRAAFGLWWPWGAGSPISLRIGLLGVDADDEPNRRLRELFDVAG